MVGLEISKLIGMTTTRRPTDLEMLLLDNTDSEEEYEVGTEEESGHSDDNF
jgi:hypothetical protein